MKKFIIISSFFLVIILTSSMIGYKVVSANTKINEADDIISYQEEKEDYLTYYNYTLDNPNIVLNPYGISPLTALIMFETDTEEEVFITIIGKDKNSTYTNKFKKSKKHYIPVYGLYPNYNNKIIINCGNITKEYNIQTDKLPKDLIITPKENNTNNLYFITSNKYPYAIDSNNEVRWYLTNNYTGKISRLENGNLLLSNNSLIDDKHTNGLLEIDLLGKIYKEYDIGTCYLGSYAETSKNLLILSNDLLEIDKQTGLILRKIKLDKTYNKVTFNKSTNKIFLENYNDNLEIDYKTEKKVIKKSSNILKENEILLPLYNIDSYKISKGIKFNNPQETTLSNKSVVLLNYKKIDDNYQDHNIEIIKETNRLVIKGNFKKSKEAYIILDKFLDKKVYDLKDGYNYINETGLSGDYSIYIKLNNKIYKTNNYVTF